MDSFENINYELKNKNISLFTNNNNLIHNIYNNLSSFAYWLEIISSGSSNLWPKFNKLLSLSNKINTSCSQKRENFIDLRLSQAPLSILLLNNNLNHLLR